MIETLKKIPSNKMPPCAIYKKLVKATGLRNSWTAAQWLEYLKKGV